MNYLKDKIKECKNKKELESLKIEIVEDTENFLENQRLYIKKKNSLKRCGNYSEKP